MNTVNQLTILTRSRARKPPVYFPDDVWKIINEYNGIIGWDKSIVDLLNKPALLKLEYMLKPWFDKQQDKRLFIKYIMENWRVKSKRARRKKLIQCVLKTNPNHTELIECWNARHNI